MKISQLVTRLGFIKIIGQDCNVRHLTHSSKDCINGSLYFCLKGDCFDGADYVKEAEKNGAVAIVSEEILDTPLTQIIVKDARESMSEICAEFYSNPQNMLKIIGVVGTNGKTTTCHIIENILKVAGYNVANIGTLGIKYNGKTISTDMTTPDPEILYKYLCDMVYASIDYVVMEVSAHAIYYKKISPITFDSIVYTNVSQDHLDFFDNMQEYVGIKRSVLCKKHAKRLIINADDELGREVIKQEECFSYGIENPCDVFAINVEENENGIKYVMNLFDDVINIKCPLIGMHNVYNTLAAATCLYEEGIDNDDIAYGIKELAQVSGRGQFCAKTIKGGKVYVDYAHTPDGLKKILFSMKNISKGKLICLFGCGGNRDKSKREIMGEVSGGCADFTIITTDNPRFEDALKIMSQIEKGVRKKTLSYISIADRYQAIEYGINMLEEGDVLLVAGKGGETTQEVMGIKREFNDAEVINEIIGGKNVRKIN